MVNEYWICYAHSAEELKKAVNDAIKNGWQPFGGVSVSANIKWNTGEEHDLVAQAVVRLRAN